MKNDNGTKPFVKYLDQLTKAFDAFPWENKEAYSSWLAQTYHFVLSSTRLIALASACSTQEQDKLHIRFIQHAAEEKGHEKLLINDVKALGHTMEKLPVYPQTSTFFQSQYYWIEHVNAASFMGYIYALEGLAVRSGTKAYERVLKAHGKKAASFLMVHSAEDVEHLKKAEEVISKFSKEEFDAFMENLKCSAWLYEQILQDCAATTRKAIAA